MNAYVCASPDRCSDDDYNLALTDGAFNKLIQVQLVRKIEGEQFFGVSFLQEIVQNNALYCHEYKLHPA